MLLLYFSMKALVLGGGAAKGYAHIGVIKFLEERGFKPDLIIGTSMGALVGGFYATGSSIKELEKFAAGIDLKMKQKLFPIQLSSQGFIQGDYIVKFLYKKLGKIKIENLPIKYACTAVDLDRQHEIVIDKGDLVQAIRSSISIPVVFVPHEHYGHTFIDGGFVNPVPITAARLIGATRIIAVNVLRRTAYPSCKLKKVRSSSKKYNAWEVMMNTLNLGFSRLIDYQFIQLEDGFMIDINTNDVKLSDFEKARMAIDIGYKQAKNYRREIDRFIGQQDL